MSKKRAPMLAYVAFVFLFFSVPIVSSQMLPSTSLSQVQAGPVPAPAPIPSILRVSVTGGTDDLGFLAFPGNFQAIRAIATRRLANFIGPYTPLFALFSGSLPILTAVTDTNPAVDFVDLVNQLFADSPANIHVIVAQLNEWNGAVATSLIEDKQPRVVLIQFTLANKPPQLNSGPYVIVFRNDSMLGAIVQLLQSILSTAAEELGATIGDLSVPEDIEETTAFE